MKSKLLFMFLVILFVLFIFSIDSNAASILGKEFPDWPENVEDYSYMYITYNNRSTASGHGEYKLTYSKEPAYISKCFDYGDSITYYLRTNHSIYFKWNPNKGETSWSGDYDEHATDNTYLVYLPDGSEGDCVLIYASEGVLYDLSSSSDLQENNGKPFFHQTPLTTSITMQWPIGVDLWQMLARILMILIPIVVSYLGLRKALRMLSMQLHKS